MVSIGIVGLPNVGKSTLFETLTQKEVDRSNYPFATIDPNVGVVAVPDDRIDKLVELLGPAEKKYATIEFVDIAGLVRNAHKGEGLGNQFLAHIREVDAVVLVLRAFLDENVAHTEASVNPLRDKEILDTELGLKDQDVVLKRLDHIQKDIRAKNKGAIEEFPVLEKAKKILEVGELLVSHSWEERELEILNQYQLLTLKPRLYLLNRGNEEVPDEVVRELQKDTPTIVFNITDELASAGLSKKERQALGLSPHSAVERLIGEAYKLLNLITFFTVVGGREAHAWASPAKTPILKAAGKIHRDFAKYFIRAEVIEFKELVASCSFETARQKGLVRTEGKNYIVQEGDILEIRHNA